jgi:hypothetical protein
MKGIILLEPATPSIFIIFPGARGLDEYTHRIKSEVQASDAFYESARLTICYDWKRFMGSFLTAAYNGQRVGQQLALDFLAKLEAHNSTIDIHAVGISVGAFAADSFISEVKKQKERGSNSYCRLTLLDPFTSRGIFGWKNGKKHFGLSADYCEVYLNTDDPVPFTNAPLPNACNFDITSAAERKTFAPRAGDSMHSWPAAYFGRYWRERIDPRVNKSLFTASHDVNARGRVIRMERLPCSNVRICVCLFQEGMFIGSCNK